ncbi:stonustoxin subunit beta-like [Megalobrama amblycephala]|uniref:stonustoxin subunit beta-like n=1 Tax=Megalobrama amblycephala TaxID=75352 RepID=UPI0020144861|nr:stonustoxin subunit beta-like [Megalobrama amblycephala]
MGAEHLQRASFKLLQKALRLTDGISSSVSAKEGNCSRSMENIIEECEGVRAYIDDIIWGSSLQEHNNRLTKVLQKIKSSETKQKQMSVSSRDTARQIETVCRESMTGRCYWEVEWSGDGRSGVGISVTNKSINRKGNSNESVSGCNDQSWKLFCSPDYCSFWHNNIETKLPVVSSSRIGVYVDHSAGILSFYSVSDTMSLIHRVQTTFTQPLYAVFGFDMHSRMKLCCLTS